MIPAGNWSFTNVRIACAEVITSKETAATTCVYCNRAITLEGNLTGEFRPDYVLPFTTTREDVTKEYLKLAKKSVLTPRLFTKKSTVEKIKGMYVPSGFILSREMPTYA